MSCENFIHEQFSTEGISLLQRVISTEEKDILRGFVDGTTDAFQNPVGSLINGVSSGVSTTLTSIADAIGGGGPPQLADLESKLTTLTTNISSFKNHTDRLSGVNLDVGADGLPNISGVAGMASAITDAKSMMSEEGAPVEDNFSQMFGSIAGGGQKMMSDAMDVVNSLNNLDLTDTNAISNMVSSIEDISCRLDTAQTSDIEAFDKAGEYLNKLSVGQSAISMTKSMNFNKVLSDLVMKPDIKNQISNIPKPEIPNLDIETGFVFPEVPNIPDIPEIPTSL